MVNLTRSDLFHSKGKLVIVMIGLIMSVFLVQFSFGMYFGAIREYSRIAEEYGHDAWVTYEDMEMLMAAGLIDDTIYDEIKDIDGVEQVDRLMYLGVGIEGKDNVKYINLIAFDTFGDIEPFNRDPTEKIPNDWKDLIAEENSIIIDKSIQDYLDVEKGDKLNIENTVDFTVADFSEGGLLMGTPFAWCSIETARNLFPWAGNVSTAFGIKFENGYTFEEFEEDIKDIKDISAYTPEEIRINTDDFIINKMGVGMLLFLMAGMGLVVGLIIISITVYQSVLEKIPMFGTLKAIGAEKGFINKMMFGQVFFEITLAFIIGTIITPFMDSPTMQIALNLVFSIWLYVILIATSFACAYISIRKVHKIDPGIVFRR